MTSLSTRFFGQPRLTKPTLTGAVAEGATASGARAAASSAMERVAGTLTSVTVAGFIYGRWFGLEIDCHCGTVGADNEPRVRFISRLRPITLSEDDNQPGSTK